MKAAISSWHLHEIHLVAGAFERAHDPVDAVAGISIDAMNVPFGEALDEKVGDGLIGHAPNRCK
jgi:hypothetical protein